MAIEVKKESIDYLQFLNYPELDKEIRVWFFTYLDPITEDIKHVKNIYKLKLFAAYKKVKKKLLRLQKKRNIKIETDTIVDVTTKKKGKFKTQNLTIHNKLISKEFLTKALELKLQGHDKENIALELKRIYKISLLAARGATQWCYQELAKSIDEDFIKLTILNHSLCYDDLYKKMIELEAPRLALRTLRNKEILNGIGSDIFEIQVNNIFDDQSDFIQYDIQKLTNSEQREFKEILTKISMSNEQKQKQKQKQLNS